MKELAEFKNWLKSIIENNIEDEQLEFVWELMESPYIEFHYNLLQDQTLDDDFKRHLAFRFTEHGEQAEDFLIQKLDDNEDLEFQADIIFLLGKLNKKHKSKILAYTREFTKSENDYKRDRAIIVLGWIGKAADANILENHLLNDTNSNCRAWSASAYMQMWFRKENDLLKTKAFEAYKAALPNESDYFVLSVILSAIREMGNTKLGVSKSALDELDTEKIDLAKIKAIRFLDKVLKR
ncbi:HEAT repeat domain-containing protein [Flavobacterium cerinum]|uniref:HEAT repeat domain-containing protein n=1 Tax=Flavobacterium cerinum TaxID=2502784 RepID=A0A3S3S749_9FLAO|nr:HEAT repeat domain-containing protein [Flavobacterium cerinum]RWW91802.1 HEAT repeat domain-containing protein [Flavobacterium cerinum]